MRHSKRLQVNIGIDVLISQLSKVWSSMWRNSLECHSCLYDVKWCLHETRKWSEKAMRWTYAPFALHMGREHMNTHYKKPNIWYIMGQSKGDAHGSWVKLIYYSWTYNTMPKCGFSDIKSSHHTSHQFQWRFFLIMKSLPDCALSMYFASPSVVHIA